MLTPIETLPVDDSTRIAVFYDDDWQVDADVDKETQVAMMNAAANNGVYGVAIERLTRYAQIDDDANPVQGSEFTRWELDDSIWGCFLDDNYTARTVAEEYFGVIAL